MFFKKIDEVTKLSVMNFFLNLFFFSPIIVFFYQQRGLNFFQILALESVLMIFVLFFEVPTGLFADKFGRKKSVIVGTFLLLVENVIFLFSHNFWTFAFCFAISGIGYTFLSGTIEAMIYDHLKSQKKQRFMSKAMGTYGSAALLAMVVAPPIGSIIAKDLLMPQFIITILMTIGAMAIGFLISFMIKDTRAKKVVEEGPFTLLKEGMKIIKKNKSLIHIILLSIFTSSFFYAICLLYQQYFKNSGVNVVIYGWIFALALLLSALAKKYSYKLEDIFGKRISLFLATAVPGVFYIMMAFVFHPFWALVLFVGLMAFMGFRDPLISQYTNIHIPSRNRATVLSLMSMLVGLYLVIMRLVFGKLADINLSYSFALMGGVIIVGSVVLNLLFKFD